MSSAFEPAIYCSFGFLGMLKDCLVLWNHSRFSQQSIYIQIPGHPQNESIFHEFYDADL